MDILNYGTDEPARLVRPAHPTYIDVRFNMQEVYYLLGLTARINGYTASAIQSGGNGYNSDIYRALLVAAHIQPGATNIKGQALGLVDDSRKIMRDGFVAPTSVVVPVEVDNVTYSPQEAAARIAALRKDAEDLRAHIRGAVQAEGTTYTPTEAGERITRLKQDNDDLMARKVDLRMQVETLLKQLTKAKADIESLTLRLDTANATLDHIGRSARQV